MPTEMLAAPMAPAYKPSSFWAVKPVFIGAISAVLLCLLIASICALSFLLKAEWSIPLVPLFAFILVRATMAAFAPTPKNFSTVQGQLHFLISQGSALAGLCFAYATMKSCIDFLASEQKSSFQYSLAALAVSAVLAVCVMAWSLALQKRFSIKQERGLSTSSVENLQALTLYSLSCCLTAVYVSSILPIKDGRSVISWTVELFPSFPALASISVIVLTYFVLGNFATKSVENIRQFILKSDKDSENPPEASEFVSWQFLPVLPSLAVEVIFRFINRRFLQASLAFVVFIVVVFAIATFVSAAQLAGETAPIVQKGIDSNIEWVGANPSLLIWLFISIVAVAFFAALCTKLPYLISEATHHWEILKKQYWVWRLDRLLKQEDRRHRKLAGVMQKAQSQSMAASERSQGLSQKLEYAKLELQRARSARRS